MTEYDRWLDRDLDDYYSDEDEIPEDDDWLIDQFIEKAIQDQEDLCDE